MRDLRIIFMGTPDFAVTILKHLVENKYTIAGVITAPDKPAGRGRKLNESAVKKYANSQNLNILQPINLKNEEFWVISVENGVKAKDWHRVDYTGKVFMIAGSEGRGIKKLVLENSDFHATIPMQGKTNSLNVSAAVSAVLFERLRQLSG